MKRINNISLFIINRFLNSYNFYKEYHHGNLFHHLLTLLRKYTRTHEQTQTPLTKSPLQSSCSLLIHSQHHPSSRWYFSHQEIQPKSQSYYCHFQWGKRSCSRQVHRKSNKEHRTKEIQSKTDKRSDDKQIVKHSKKRLKEFSNKTTLLKTNNLKHISQINLRNQKMESNKKINIKSYSQDRLTKTTKRLAFKINSRQNVSKIISQLNHQQLIHDIDQITNLYNYFYYALGIVI